MPAEAIIDGARWALMAVFVLTAVEKGQTLWAQSAAWHPVMLVSQARRRHARTLMAGALVADLAVLGLLVLLPRVGGVAGAVLVAAYTLLAVPVYSSAGGGAGCRCFWKVLDTTTWPGSLARNLVLVALALGVGLQSPTGLGLPELASAVALIVVLSVFVAGVDGRFRPAYGRDPKRDEGDEAPAPAIAITPAAYASPRRGGDVR